MTGAETVQAVDWISGMYSHWKRFLTQHAAEWSLPEDGHWNLLLNNNYHPHGCNLNLLWFHNGESYPRVVAKLFPGPEAPSRESKKLAQVYKCAPQWAPRHLHFGAIGPHWGLWIEGVPGSPLLKRPAEHSPAQLTSLVEALSSIHKAVGGVHGTEMSITRKARLISGPLEAVAQFRPSPRVQEVCGHLSAAISTEWIEALPVIPQHGDLFPSNVLVHGKQYHFIDWETFGEIDLPMHDLITLLVSILGPLGKSPREWDASIVRQLPVLQNMYADRMGLSSSYTARLLPLSLANSFYFAWLEGRLPAMENFYDIFESYCLYQEQWLHCFSGIGNAGNLSSRALT